MRPGTAEASTVAGSLPPHPPFDFPCRAFTALIQSFAVNPFCAVASTSLTLRAAIFPYLFLPKVTGSTAMGLYCRWICRYICYLVTTMKL